MSLMFEKTEFLSSDGKNTVSAKWWIPDSPKAVVQLAHGMAEYIMRYDAFARFLAENGYAVCGNDHLGHGESAAEEADLGFMGEKDGHLLVAGDMHKLTLIAKERFPGLPVILFGHSMGSFLARLYASAWSADIDALIVCGTSGPNPAAGAGIGLIKFLKLFCGTHHRSKLIDSIAFGSYLKGIKNPKTNSDWLSTDPDVVQRYVDDPLCGYLFTLCGFEALFSMLGIVSLQESVDKIRKDLPVLFVAGDKDPVGAGGEGVKAVAEMFRAGGIKDVRLKLYEGARHEILNDFCRVEAMADILAFCDGAIAK